MLSRRRQSYDYVEKRQRFFQIRDMVNKAFFHPGIVISRTKEIYATAAVPHTDRECHHQKENTVVIKILPAAERGCRGIKSCSL